MAGFPNIVDVTWVLSEETGQLMYESFRLVHSRPRQRILLAGAAKGQLVSEELLKRYTRITEDRAARGIK